ncbi:MAG: tRNA 4-thiouridine(8) synthase ThiI [Oscillospiraceae bacterium]|jgi:thiamine biosynthesis protein ThiI|nr:tRNA 4-thiouridine(8) synthase ThiI [Oscillospiraceae bacterium]
MHEVILIKYGELTLKGLNRRSFEERLVKNLKRRLAPLGSFHYTYAQSTLTVAPVGGVSLGGAGTIDNGNVPEAKPVRAAQGDERLPADVVRRVGMVFGIAAYCRALCLPKSMDALLDGAGAFLAHDLLAARTFKCEAKRADKTFPLDSPQISAQLGERLLKQFPHLRVDVHNPEVTVTAEVRDRYIFVHGKQIPGAGGLPAGSSGRVLLLISGGIDSPVAGWMMARRGVNVVGVHFASPPYTGPRAEKKVHTLMGKVAEYTGGSYLHTVQLTRVQEAIKQNCPEELGTVLTRRMMMRVAERIAFAERAEALVTGENLGQVASQTLPALASTDSVCTLPVFRPLIGMDKQEIVAIARRIDTFDTSVLPYEDCCTVFTPKHPRTRPNAEIIAKVEEALDIEALVNACVANEVGTVIV